MINRALSQTGLIFDAIQRCVEDLSSAFIIVIQLSIFRTKRVTKLSERPLDHRPGDEVVKGGEYFGPGDSSSSNPAALRSFIRGMLYSRISSPMGSFKNPRTLNSATG